MMLDSLTQTTPRARVLCALALALALSPALSSDATRAQSQTQDAKAAAEANHFEVGKLLLKDGNAAAAVEELKPVAERRKTDGDAWYLLGVALSQLGRHKDARKAFEKAIKLNPDDAGSRAGRAYSLLMLGKLRDAEKEALRAVGADARNADAHFVLGALRFNEDRFAEAEAEAATAFGLKPDFVTAAHLQADALLNVYTDEAVRQGQQYPVSPGMSEEERKAIYAKREPAYELLRVRLRALADRLEALAASSPNSSPGAADLREQIETLRFYGRPGGPAGIMRTDEVTTKAIITSKPEPGFTQEAREHNTTGTVRLRAVLGADGRVTHIIPIKRLPNGLTERCIEAARRIRFQPATFNGQPVSQFVILEYNFNIY
jgi:tetratricopeptide (TPR) repeat protein